MLLLGPIRALREADKVTWPIGICTLLVDKGTTPHGVIRVLTILDTEIMGRAVEATAMVVTLALSRFNVMSKIGDSILL